MTLLERMQAAGLDEQQAAAAVTAANAHITEEGYATNADFTAAAQERDAANEQVRNLRMDYAIRSALTAANAQYPDLLSARINREALTIAEDGTVSGVDEQLAALQQSYAGLFALPAAPPAQPPAAPPAAKPKSVPPVQRTYQPPAKPTQVQLDAMTDAEYYAYLNTQNK